MGYPVVTINRNNRLLTAVQNWFLLNPKNTIQNTLEYKNATWYVPITFTTQKLRDFDFEKRPRWLKPSDIERKQEKYSLYKLQKPNYKYQIF